MKKVLPTSGIVFLLHLCLAFSQPLEKLSLRDAITLALKGNPEILRAQQEIDVASGRVLQAGRIPNPELGVSWNETPSNFNIGEADERDIGISQQIEFPTKRSNRVEVAGLDKEIAELQVDRVVVLVTARLKKAYYNLLFSEQIAVNLHQQARLLNDFLEIASARIRSGAGDYLDVIRAKVELTRLNNEIVEAQREMQARKVRLNVLLGRSPEQAIELTDSLSPPSLRIRKDTLFHRLIDQSATLKIAQRRIGRSQSSVSLAKTSYLPDFSVGLFHQQRAEQPPFDANQFTGITTKSFGVQLGISIPLWFWQEPKGLVEEASALANIAELNLSATERRIRASMLNALNLLKAAEALVDVFDSTLLEDVSDILKAGISRYQNNQIDALNLIDIYRTNRAAKVEYARALLNYLSAAADLEAAAEQEFEDQ